MTRKSEGFSWERRRVALSKELAGETPALPESFETRAHVTHTRLVGRLGHAAVEQSSRMVDNIFPVERWPGIHLVGLDMKMA